MFRCQKCGKVSGARTKSSRIVVATREKEYKGDVEEFTPRRFGRFREARKPRDRGGRGYEIVKELMVCTACAETHHQQAAAAARAAAATEAANAVTEAAEAPASEE